MCGLCELVSAGRNGWAGCYNLCKKHLPSTHYLNIGYLGLVFFTDSVYTRSDSKVMRLFFSWLYWQYCSPPTQKVVLPWSFLYPDLQWHAFTITNCGAGAWRVNTCFRTSSRKWIARNIAQRYLILFCVKLGDSATTTHGKLQQAFGGDAMSRA